MIAIVPVEKVLHLVEHCETDWRGNGAFDPIKSDPFVQTVKQTFGVVHYAQSCYDTQTVFRMTCDRIKRKNRYANATLIPFMKIKMLWTTHPQCECEESGSLQNRFPNSVLVLTISSVNYSSLAHQCEHLQTIRLIPSVILFCPLCSIRMQRVVYSDNSKVNDGIRLFRTRPM